MQKMGLFSSLLLSLMVLGACSISKFNKMSSVEQMNTVMKGAKEAQKNLEAYDRVNKTVKTVDQINKVTDSLSTDPGKEKDKSTASTDSAVAAESDTK